MKRSSKAHTTVPYSLYPLFAARACRFTYSVQHELRKVSNLTKALLTNGSQHQAFIGAKWLVSLLRAAPSPVKRSLALRTLALSPHYFYRNKTSEYENMRTNRFLEAEFERNRISRERFCNQVIRPHLKPDDRVLDIGCGPGFLARRVADHVKTIYACDISRGVLECARIINHAPNIQYICSNESGFQQIPDWSLDLAYSTAVIQHLRESVIKTLFKLASTKLRTGGRCLFQVQLEDCKSKTETECDGDKSAAGRLRSKYGLNFFPRSESFFREVAAETGFSFCAIQPLSELLDHPFDDMYYQHLIVLSKL